MILMTFSILKGGLLGTYTNATDQTLQILGQPSHIWESPLTFTN